MGAVDGEGEIETRCKFLFGAEGKSGQVCLAVETYPFTRLPSSAISAGC